MDYQTQRADGCFKRESRQWRFYNLYGSEGSAVVVTDVRKMDGIRIGRIFNQNKNNNEMFESCKAGIQGGETKARVENKTLKGLTSHKIHSKLHKTPSSTH